MDSEAALSPLNEALDIVTTLDKQQPGQFQDAIRAVQGELSVRERLASDSMLAGRFCLTKHGLPIATGSSEAVETPKFEEDALREADIVIALPPDGCRIILWGHMDLLGLAHDRYPPGALVEFVNVRHHDDGGRDPENDLNRL